jgi:hypothetical protein
MASELNFMCSMDRNGSSRHYVQCSMPCDNCVAGVQTVVERWES